MSVQGYEHERKTMLDIPKCPLLQNTKCLQIDCEWWHGDKEACSIYIIADSLDTMQEILCDQFAK